MTVRRLGVTGLRLGVTVRGLGVNRLEVAAALVLVGLGVGLGLFRFRCPDLTVLADGGGMMNYAQIQNPNRPDRLWSERRP